MIYGCPLCKMLRYMANVRRNLAFVVPLSHEVDRIPMFCGKLDVLLTGELFCYLFRPGGRVDQIAFVIGVW